MADEKTDAQPTDGKVPMPASGQNSPRLRSDGVSDAGTHGRSVGGESGGGSYENPHTGKEARGESGDFEGGQSEQAYHGPEPLKGGKVPEENDPIDKGRGGSG